MRILGKEILIIMIKGAMGAIAGHYAIKGVKAAEDFNKSRKAQEL